MNSGNSMQFFELSDQEMLKESQIGELVMPPEISVNQIPQITIPILSEPPPLVTFEPPPPVFVPPASIPEIPDVFELRLPKISMEDTNNSSFSVLEVFENANKAKKPQIVNALQTGTKRDECSMMNIDVKKKLINEAPIVDNLIIPPTLNVLEINRKTPANSLNTGEKLSREMKPAADISYTNPFFRNASDNIGNFGGGFGGLNTSLFDFGE